MKYIRLQIRSHMGLGKTYALWCTLAVEGFLGNKVVIANSSPWMTWDTSLAFTVDWFREETRKEGIK